MIEQILQEFIEKHLPKGYELFPTAFGFFIKDQDDHVWSRIVVHKTLIYVWCWGVPRDLEFPQIYYADPNFFSKLKQIVTAPTQLAGYMI